MPGRLVDLQQAPAQTPLGTPGMLQTSQSQLQIATTLSSFVQSVSSWRQVINDTMLHFDHATVSQDVSQRIILHRTSDRGLARAKNGKTRSVVTTPQQQQQTAADQHNKHIRHTLISRSTNCQAP